MDLSTLDLDQVRHRWGDEDDEQAFSVDVAAGQETVMETMRSWAKRGEAAKKCGVNPIPPPMGILDHPGTVCLRCVCSSSIGIGVCSVHH